MTISALIARKQTIEMPYHVNLALDNGVKPSAISEIVTHFAFYSGWAHAMSAVAVAKDVCCGLPETAPVVSCDEAEREGFGLHRFLQTPGITNQVDSSSIEGNRRTRRAKTMGETYASC